MDKLTYIKIVFIKRLFYIIAFEYISLKIFYCVIVIIVLFHCEIWWITFDLVNILSNLLRLLKYIWLWSTSTIHLSWEPKVWGPVLIWTSFDFLSSVSSLHKWNGQEVIVSYFMVIKLSCRISFNPIKIDSLCPC